MRWPRLPRRRRHGTPGRPGHEDEHDRARSRMVAEQLAARGIGDPELLRAFRTVERHRFVEGGAPYGDHAMPVGSGQTISQPYVVAEMTEIARPDEHTGYERARVLEIGTGSGYQAAILAELGADVVSIERHQDLAEGARERLERAGYADHVQIEVGDGTNGWPARAPYRSILVTAAGPSVPGPLLEQLDPNGGKLVMPVGGREHQMLTLVQRVDTELTSTTLDPVVFVPLIGSHGFAPD